MVVCLDNLVGKRFWGSKGGFRKGVNYDASSFIQARKLGRNMQEFTKILMSIKGCSLDSKRKWWMLGALWQGYIQLMYLREIGGMLCLS